MAATATAAGAPASGDRMGLLGMPSVCAGRGRHALRPTLAGHGPAGLFERPPVFSFQSGACVGSPVYVGCAGMGLGRLCLRRS
jgi:hypothetical protein